MAEAKSSFIFSHKEVAEALVKQQDLHHGIWGLYIEFGIGATNIKQPGSEDLTPAAIVPVVKVGIQKFEEENNLTVDAAKVNPLPRTTSKKKRERKCWYVVRQKGRCDHSAPINSSSEPYPQSSERDGSGVIFWLINNGFILQI